MSRDDRFWRKWALLGGLLSISLMGCGPSTLAFLFRDTEIKPAQPLAHHEDKKEVTVLLLVSSAPTIGMDFAGSDKEIATLAGKQLEEGSKKEKHPIKVVDAGKLEKLRNSPGFSARNPASIAKQLGADYVLDVTVSSMKMIPAQFGGEFLEGEAVVSVVVYDSAKPDSIHRQYELSPKLPMKGTASVTTGMYRRMLVAKIANEIAWQHVPHEQEMMGH